ncbi:MAG: 3-deoxy-7-phosphoheptulonate synthase [Planctomycetes bacterium]|nr:3-deoxy-7-phosphoheptulonate synthase [Planctomycetota bacterium]
MWLELDRGADPGRVQRELSALGLWVTRCSGPQGIGFWVQKHSAHLEPEALQIEGVRAVFPQASPHPRVDALAGLTFRAGPLSIGGEAPVALCAGPCSVESRGQIEEAAAAVAEAGGRALRGGAYKPRTSPHAFQGHGARALGWMRDAADRHGLAMITEAVSEAEVPRVAEFADVIQVGARSMQSYGLLRAIGEAGKPVLLKRGLAAQLEEWLLAAEHLLVAGSGPIAFCERGVRSFDPSTRNLLDVGVVALLASVYRLPVLADPSHAAGRRDLVVALGRAGLAAGAHGLLVEFHPDPASALSDGPQALDRAGLLALGQSCGTTLEVA